MLELTAYTDESGNTGQNLFDPSQEHFWTGTLVTAEDIEFFGHSTIEKCCKMLEVNALHGNELGVGRLEKIAPWLENYIQGSDFYFVFTKVEKRHISCTKFFDILMDNAINEAVSWLHYGYRALRFPLVCIVRQHFSDADERTFWDAYRNTDSAQFAEVVKNVRSSIINGSVTSDFPVLFKVDDRSKEILVDALDWALQHPDVLIEEQSALDSPNLIAFTLLLEGIRHVVDPEKGLIKRFVHDEQNQFARAMSEAFDLVANFSMPTDPLAWLGKIERVEMFDCGFETASDLVGLQLADVVLWLMKRNFRPDQLEQLPQISSLLKTVLSSGYISEFSRIQLVEDTFHCLRVLESLPITSKQLKKGKSLQKKFERQRRQRITASTLQ